LPKQFELARLLDAPALARVVPQLPPETLHKIIRHHGLDATVELMVLATPAQLTSLADLDLWRAATPGHDGQFDVDRFAEWIEALVEAGDSVAAKTIASLDANIAIAGLSRYIRVLDPGIFEPIAQSDDEAIDRHEALREGDVIDAGDDGDRLECEVGGYIIRARRTDAWDAIVSLLVALDVEQTETFHRLIRGCREISNSNPEIGGLHDLLLEHEQHLHDVAADRERRRSQQGYATPADARAFLKIARDPARPKIDADGKPAMNPIVAAYFWATEEEAVELTTSADAHQASASNDDSQPLAGVVELLTDAGLMPEAPRALLGSSAADPKAAKLARLRQLMDYASHAGDAVFFTRHRELAFLANILLAGCSVQSRPFTPQEAADAAASICNLGLELSHPEASSPEASVSDHALIDAFETGWAALHQDVSLFAARQLIATLKDLGAFDKEVRRDLTSLRRALVTQADAGTPWLARKSADVLSILDATAAAAVLGLLDECPIMPAALIAILDGRTTAVSPTAFEFISSTVQIADVRSFVRKLPGVLAG
jgi:hypothetical protein